MCSFSLQLFFFAYKLLYIFKKLKTHRYVLKILSLIVFCMHVYWLYTYNHLIHPSFWWINKDNQIVKLNNMFQRFKTKPTNFCPWITATYVEISFCYFFNSIAKLYLIIIFYESHSCQLFQARIIFSHLIQK